MERKREREREREREAAVNEGFADVQILPHFGSDLKKINICKEISADSTY